MKKRNFKYLFIAIILIAFTHCKKEEIKTLSISTTTKTVSKARDGFTFAIYSNTDWTVISNQNWCIVNQSSGSENDNISITIIANTTSSERTAIITINGTDVNSQTITVIQEAGDDPQQDYITVTKPTSGTTCSVGAKLELAWESSGVESTTIQLYSYGYKLLDIETSGYANGTGTWTLPTYLSNGSNYQIYIESNQNSSISDLSEYFTVTGGSSSDYITVTSPTSSNSWETGNSYTIQWNDNISENVSIKLYNGSSFIETIASSTSSDGSYTWSVSSSLSSGSNYNIKITSTSNSSIYDYSDYFSITTGGSNDYITITSPTSSSAWETGQSYTIYWDDNIAENVFIRLYKNGEPSAPIAYDGNGTNSDGAYTWTVPTNLVSNDNYQIAIWSVDDNTIYDYSEYFSITNNGSASCTFSTDAVGGGYSYDQLLLTKTECNITTEIYWYAENAGNFGRWYVKFTNNSNEVKDIWYSAIVSNGSENEYYDNYCETGVQPGETVTSIVYYVIDGTSSDQFHLYEIIVE